jgi:hypothetical protein
VSKPGRARAVRARTLAPQEGVPAGLVARGGRHRIEQYADRLGRAGHLQDQRGPGPMTVEIPRRALDLVNVAQPRPLRPEGAERTPGSRKGLRADGYAGSFNRTGPSRAESRCGLSHFRKGGREPVLGQLQLDTLPLRRGSDDASRVLRRHGHSAAFPMQPTLCQWPLGSPSTVPLSGRCERVGPVIRDACSG